MDPRLGDSLQLLMVLSRRCVVQDLLEQQRVSRNPLHRHQQEGRQVHPSHRRLLAECDQLGGEGRVLLAQGLENPDGGALLDAVWDVHVDVGDVSVTGRS